MQSGNATRCVYRINGRFLVEVDGTGAPSGAGDAVLLYGAACR
jgi:hypothetical protein